MIYNQSISSKRSANLFGVISFISTILGFEVIIVHLKYFTTMVKLLPFTIESLHQKVSKFWAKNFGPVSVLATLAFVDSKNDRTSKVPFFCGFSIGKILPFATRSAKMQMQHLYKTPLYIKFAKINSRTWKFIRDVSQCSNRKSSEMDSVKM
ncbi:hypothetical protein KP509_11G083600 [Ceratopteris richardii]|uniref:Uncharacterized protein n=1 Tax=Ceratopteris richardii TaxID=49495 RepID=A0A8T2U070_CERRI|nr:hypothetical protein KP509_11G083600 [Ceratopteris richardii]